MTILKFILRSLYFFKKQHLVVLIGTILSTAVLTGALIIGDSVKLSLLDLVKMRLGNIEYILPTGDRLVREQLALDIEKNIKSSVAPALIIQAITANPQQQERINKTNVIGIDQRFWKLSNLKMPDLKGNEAIVSENIAEKLKLKIGDEFILRVENLSPVPVNTPFGTQDVPSISFRLQVKTIANKNSLGRFSLMSNQDAPFNVFLSLPFLAKKMDIPGKVNLILVANNERSMLTAESLNSALLDVWKPADAGIDLHKLNNTSEVEMTSERIFLDQKITDAVLKSNNNSFAILTYLVNSIRHQNISTPYSFVTAVSNTLYADEIGDNEIIINQWLAEDLSVKKGDTLTLRYFTIGPLQTLKEDSCVFIIKKIIPTNDSIINTSLMPKFPGIKETGDCKHWNTNTPINLKLIRNKDEAYWKRFKGTPKALVALKTALHCWKNNFGKYTALRFKSAGKSTDSVGCEIMKLFSPSDLNLKFISVKQEGRRAASNSVDFGQLFLSLSFFVIASSILLSVLLQMLFVASREAELATLYTIGFTRRQLYIMRVSENVFSILVACVIGILVGIAYSFGIMSAINSIWNDMVRTNSLQIYIIPSTLLLGGCSGLLIALITLYFVLRKKINKSVSTSSNLKITNRKKARSKNISFEFVVGIIVFLMVLIIIVYSVLFSIERNAEMVMLAGGLLLLSFYLFFAAWMKTYTNKIIYLQHLVVLALKNVVRNKIRSLSVVIILSLGSFVVLIVGANRNSYRGTEDVRKAGTGGYTFWAETSMPLSYNINDVAGREKYGISNTKEWNEIEFVQLHAIKGDDASCLNLNQVKKPGIIGVPQDMFDKRNSFLFSNFLDKSNPKHPWLKLKNNFQNNIIPAFADQSVITWGLQKKLGDTLEYTNEAGEKLKLVLIGALNSSIFQGNVIVAEQYVLSNFPSLSGSKIMLIDAPSGKRDSVKAKLNEVFKDAGIEITSTSERLAQFYSVTNTYLSVFMMLGGLGVIIGTIGLGIIMYRNVLERKSEIALLRAIGFSKIKIIKLVLIENVFLITIGNLAGIVAAIISILPSLLSASFSFSGNFVFYLNALIIINSFFWILLPLKIALKTSVVDGLRKE